MKERGRKGKEADESREGERACDGIIVDNDDGVDGRVRSDDLEDSSGEKRGRKFDLDEVVHLAKRVQEPMIDGWGELKHASSNVARTSFLHQKKTEVRLKTTRRDTTRRTVHWRRRSRPRHTVSASAIGAASAGLAKSRGSCRGARRRPARSKRAVQLEQRASEDEGRGD